MKTLFRLLAVLLILGPLLAGCAGAGAGYYADPYYPPPPGYGWPGGRYPPPPGWGYPPGHYPPGFRPPPGSRPPPAHRPPPVPLPSGPSVLPVPPPPAPMPAPMPGLH